MARKLIYGVGTYAAGAYVSYANGKSTEEYGLWKNMLERCYSDTCQKKHPTYIGCSVSAEFMDFQRFMLWAEKQVGFGLQGFQLDKDLLGRGNKVYSEGTCSFIPREVNQLIISCKSSRGEWPVGVSLCKRTGRFQAKVNLGACGKQHWLGRFYTPEEAFAAYKTAKEAFIKQRANEFRDQIDPRAYDALMAYEINITD